MNKRFYQVFALVMALLIIGVGSVMATTNQPDRIIHNWKSGNAAFECRQLNSLYDCAYKIDNDTSGNPKVTAECGDWSTEITISNSNGYVFDWASKPMGISAVIVKAGRGANVWLYNPAATDDSRLYGYQNKQISHVTFCWNGRDVPPPQRGAIDVLKFCDANANGILDDTEVDFGLLGWKINFDPDPSCSGLTDEDGLLGCANLEAGKYEVSEVVKPGFAHTATCVDGYCGYCSVTTATLCNLDEDCTNGETCTPNGPATAAITIRGGDTHTVAFGNVGLGTISGRKYSGFTYSDGIAGVKILLYDSSGTQIGCEVTNAFGNYSFTGLLPGTYTVTEEKPAGTKPTTPTSCTKTLAVEEETCAGATETCNFGNACLGAGGGKTLGFWSNMNGYNVMNDPPEPVGNCTDKAKNVCPELNMLVALNLRNAVGGHFDPTTYAQFRTWLLSANATNMAYMLSAQLAAMELNVEAGFVSDEAYVYAPGCGNEGVNKDFIKIQKLRNDANASLGANAVTVAPSTARTTQECLKNALDRANNNMNFVVPCPDFSASCQ